MAASYELLLQVYGGESDKVYDKLLLSVKGSSEGRKLTRKQNASHRLHRGVY